MNSLSKAPSTTFNEFLDTQLNPAQREAATTASGALLVVAGAGSGKTRVITTRITNLILNEGVEPESIVALTFTNKAAQEMKERIVAALQTTKKLPFVGTFHAYCLTLLRGNAHLLPFTPFTIIDADDQEQLIKKILKKYSANKYTTATQMQYMISLFKNRLASQNHTEGYKESWNTQLFKEVFLEYEQEKANAKCFDFDDLLVKVLDLFKTNEAFTQRLQKRVRHLLVDEYQDTSTVQHELLKSMVLDGNKQCTTDSICAVGDEDQSIYSWRGASVANMLTFQNDFAPVKVIKIEQNYRSVQPILHAANGLIGHNKLRNEKTLWSEKQAQQRIAFMTCRSSEQEAELIGSFVKTAQKKKSLRDMAILYRTHFQSRAIEEALIRHAVPYKIIGGIRFYERKEIKDVLAYLRLFVNPYDKISLMRILNCPARGLGEKFEEQLLSAWGHEPLLDFKAIMTQMITADAKITPVKKAAIEDFLALYQEVSATDAPGTLLNRIINGTEYIAYLRSNYEAQEADTKVENVQEFYQSVLDFEKKMSKSGNNQNLLELLLQEIALLQEKMNTAEQEQCVQMMTLHSAKGLEFDTIIISGLEEGILPGSKSLSTLESLEEERRLFYVGITRAKEYLLLSNAVVRHTYGQLVDQAPSRFASELPREVVTDIDGTLQHEFVVKRLLEQWYGIQGSEGVMTFARPIPQPQSTKGHVGPTHSHHYAQKKKITPDTVTTSPTGCPWKKNDSVTHQKFGRGIVTGVEAADDSDFYLTVIFKVGQKKILSKFITK